jgi:frataxin
MDAAEFERLATATLKDILLAIEDGIGDELEDVELQGAVLTIKLAGGGTYVVNRHAASQEIWLSSPVSGAGHFVPAPDGSWQPTRGGKPLHDLLDSELEAATGISPGLSALLQGA